MSDTSLVFNAVGRDRGVSALLSRTASGVRSANLASAASTVALGGALASAGAHGVAFGSSMLAAVGAVGLLPAAVTAVAAAVGAAKASTFGLAAAWQATGQAATGGGGKSVSTAKAVAAAQREVKTATQALADAQRTAMDAQLAITRARQGEVERLDDLGRAAGDAALDEEAAINRVADAAKEWNAAARSGNPDAIRDADLAYRQAEHTLANVRDRVSDLGQEQDEARTKGVEGSTAVQDALRAQQDAQQQVTEAAERLALAQAAVGEASAKAASGGIDPAAAALAKLSPNGRAVILTLRALTPAWEGAFRVAQQNTFSRVSGDLQRMSSTYLPGVTGWLGRMGGSFNVAIRQSMGLATTKDTVRDVGSILDNTALSSDKLARAIRPIVNGLLQVVAVGASFLPGLSGDVGTIAGRFERWAIAARESGRMQQWISTGVTTLKSFATIAGNLVMSVVAIFRAGDDNGGTVNGLVAGSAAMRAWLESAQGQERIQQVFSTLRSILSGLADIIPVVASHGKDFQAGLDVTGSTVGFVAGHLDTLAKILPYVAAGYVVVKVAEVAGNVARVAALPAMYAQAAANWGLRSAMTAHTAALTTNTAATVGSSTATKGATVATVAGDVATKRSVIGMVAQKVALAASAVATGVMTAAQWAWNAALYANPIGLIILAVIALIAVIVLIATKTTWFQTAWAATWDFVQAYFRTALNVVTTIVTTWWAVFSGFWTGVGNFFVGIGSWISTTWGNAWDWVTNKGSQALDWFQSLPGRIKSAFLGVADIISAPFRSAFNSIARLWNGTAGRLSFTAPSWIPGIGGAGFSMPQLPMLAAGGIVPATSGGMLAVLGEGGQDEAVIPLPRGGSGGLGGGGTITLLVQSSGTAFDDAIAEIIRRFVRVKGGGDVQVAFGRPR